MRKHDSKQAPLISRIPQRIGFQNLYRRRRGVINTLKSPENSGQVEKVVPGYGESLHSTAALCNHRTAFDDIHQKVTSVPAPLSKFCMRCEKRKPMAGFKRGQHCGACKIELRDTRPLAPQQKPNETKIRQPKEPDASKCPVCLQEVRVAGHNVLAYHHNLQAQKCRGAGHRPTKPNGRDAMDRLVRGDFEGGRRR